MNYILCPLCQTPVRDIDNAKNIEEGSDEEFFCFTNVTAGMVMKIELFHYYRYNGTHGKIHAINAPPYFFLWVPEEQIAEAYLAEAFSGIPTNKLHRCKINAIEDFANYAHRFEKLKVFT